MKTFKEYLEIECNEEAKDVWKTGGQQVFTFKSKKQGKVSVLYNVEGNTIWFSFPVDGKKVKLSTKFDTVIPKNKRDPENEIFNYLSSTSY